MTTKVMASWRPGLNDGPAQVPTLAELLDPKWVRDLFWDIDVLWVLKTAVQILEERFLFEDTDLWEKYCSAETGTELVDALVKVALAADDAEEEE